MAASDNAAPLAALPDNQPTVITRRSPLSGPSQDVLNPFEKWGLQPGDRLGHFDLVELVGGGGMGRVYRALDTRLARTVALKVLPPDQAADGNTLLRFQNEAQSAARLDHPNIARVYYVGEDRGIPFIVFEFIEGVNIRDLVAKRGPLPLSEAISYTLQVTAGLAHAASRDVVHRDIKPSNILITPQGIAKLIDLGLARFQRFEGPGGDLTASGVTLGTFDYISPEQARDPRAADVRSDVYSLGCTLYYMCTGRPPFPEGTVLQKLLQHHADQPPDVRELRPDLPEDMSRLLAKMLAKDPRHRHQNPQELLDDLNLLAEQSGVPSPRPVIGATWSPPSAQPTFWGRHLPWIAPVVVLVGVAIALDYFSGRRNDPAPPSIAAGPDEATRSEFAPENPDAVAARVPVPTAAPPVEKTSPGDHPSPNPAVIPSDHAIPASAGTATPVNTSQAEPSSANSNNKGPLAGDRSAAAMEQGPAEQKIAAAPSLASATVTPATADASSKPPTTAKSSTHEKQLTVGEPVTGEPHFSSLEAACSEAHTGDVIELRFNGRLETHPIELGNRKLTIRGGKGFQPVIVFRPTDKDPLTYSRSMISITARPLTLTDVAIELDIPRDVPADSWSMFEILGSQRVRLERCWLTIRNASDQLASYHPDVAFFRVKSMPGADSAVEPSATSGPPVIIELFDMIARGEATFLRTETIQPLELSWEDGLLATTECLLSAAGGLEPPRPDDVRKIHLKHLTAALRHGLYRMLDGPSATFQLLTRIESSDSIFLGAAKVPLVEQDGVDSGEEFRRLLEWSADRNFYQDWDLFWAANGHDQRPAGQPMSFKEWRDHWGPENENLPERNRVLWKRPPDPGRPLNSHTPADYALGDAPEGNPARGAAESGDDAGLQAEQLPPVPPDGTTASIPPSTSISP